MARGREARALRRAIDEARRENAPELDWDRVERSLLQKTEDHGPALRMERASAPRISLLARAAAAAILVLALAGIASWQQAAERMAGHAAEPAPAAVAAEAVRRLEGAQLRVGAVIAAEAAPVEVHHRGRATWTLASGSRAEVRRLDEAIHLRLLEGALTAEVTPVLGPESFAVEVEELRVAVRGTRFRVERRSDEVRVGVEQGKVAVGPRREDTGQETVLTAPGGGTFGLDGRPRVGAEMPWTAENAPERLAPAPEPRGAAVRQPRSSQPARGAALQRDPAHRGRALGGPSAGGGAPLQLSSDDPRVTSQVERIVGEVERCFSDHTVPRGDIRVSVRSDLSLKVWPEGKIGASLFEPPLAPAVEACVATRIEGVTFPETDRGLTLVVKVVLGS